MEALIFTETYKTPIKFSTIRKTSTIQEEKSLLSSDIAIISLADDNYYINLCTNKD